MFGIFRRKRLPAPQPNRRRQWDDAPEGEVETLLKIKQLCSLARTSLERRFEARNEGPTSNSRAVSMEMYRYQHYFGEAFRLSGTITDPYYHDTALHFLIGVALTAQDEHYAKLLFQTIEVNRIRRAVVSEYPQLDARIDR